MKRRYTLRYRYSTDNGVTWTDFSDAVDSSQTTITQNLCTNQFKSAKDSVNFTLPATNLAVKNQLVEDLLGDKDLLFEMDIPTPVPVKWSGNDVQWDSNEVMWRSTAIGFTGYIDRSSVDLRSYPLPTALSLTAYDVSFLKLDSKVDQNMVLKSKTITEIVHTLLGIAGYSYDASSVDVADNVTLEAFVVDKDDSKTYREYIDTLLFEAGGYVLDFMPNGIARIFRIPWDDANGPLRTIDNPMNEGGIQIKSSWMQNDGIKVKWSTLEWSDANRRVWRDSINRTLPGSVMQGETLAPGDYWPKNAELKPAYMEYSAEWLDDPYLLLDTRKQNEDLSVIMVDNPWADIRASHEDGSQYTFPQPAGYPIPADFQVAPYNFTANPMIWPSVPTWTAKKAWYLLYNSSNENIILTSFEIKGKVLYRSRINTLETDGSINPKEYTSTYIYDATQAQNFLNFYWHFLNTSRFSMTWSEPMLDEDLGDVVEITQKGMAYTQDAVIVAKTMRFINDKTPVISYSAVGVAVPVLSNGVANSLVPQGGSGTATYDEVAIEQKVEEIETEVENWDFALEQSAVPRNDRIPWHPNDPDSYTDIHLTSLQKGYGVLEYWSCDGTSSPLLTYFVGANAQTTTGSTPILRIYKQETYAEIKVTMHSLDNVHSITKVIKINNETEYDHDFAVWEPLDDGTNIYLLPDHFTVNGVDYDIIKGDYFVAKVTFAPYSSGTTVVSPTGDPSAQGWYERKGNGTGAKPYYWQKTTDTSVVGGKTYGTVGSGNQKFEAGYAYIYSGSSWDGFDITDEASARKASNLLNDLVTGNVQIPESSSNFSMWTWAKNFAAQYAIINNLFSQAITILSGGNIKSENYAEGKEGAVCEITDSEFGNGGVTASVNQATFISQVGSGSYGVYKFVCETSGSSGTWRLYKDAVSQTTMTYSAMVSNYGVSASYDFPDISSFIDDFIEVTYKYQTIPGKGFYLGADGTFVCNNATANALTIKGGSTFRGDFDCTAIKTSISNPTVSNSATASTINSNQAQTLRSAILALGTYTDNTKYPCRIQNVSSSIAYLSLKYSVEGGGFGITIYTWAVTFYDSSFNPVDIASILSCTRTTTPSSSREYSYGIYRRSGSGADTYCYANSSFTVEFIVGGNTLTLNIPSSGSGLTSGQLFFGPVTTVGGVQCCPIYMKS